MKRTYENVYEIIKERSIYRNRDKYEFDYAQIWHACEHYFELLEVIKLLHKSKDDFFYTEVILEDERPKVVEYLQILLNKKFEEIYADDILDCYAKDHRIKF